MKSLEMLSKIALLKVNTSNFNNQMNKILKIIGEYSNFSRTYIFINNDDNSFTKNEFEWCNSNIVPQIHNLKKVDYKTIPSLKKILEKDGKLFSKNIKTLPEDLFKIFNSQEIKSILILPIYIDKKFNGFIGCDECTINRKWKKNDLDIISTISGIISNLYTNHYISKKIEEDKQYFENFFNTITDYILIGNLKGDIIYANTSALKVLGYSKKDLIKMNFMALNPKDMRKDTLKILRNLQIGKHLSFATKILSKKGISIPVNLRIWFGKWNNEDCIFALLKDLTKEQEALQKFTKIFKNNPALMALCNMDDKKFIDVNLSFTNKLGYSYEEIIGKTSSELNLFPDERKHEKTTQNLSSTGKIKNIELKVRAKDGSIHYGLFSGEIIESQGKKYYLTVMIDITEKKQIEQRIKELSIKDSLTNIYNRRYMYDILEGYLKKYITENKIFSIAILDIDFFKEINDTYGHIIGDHILIEFTKIIEKHLSQNQTLGRYGGEEFIIVSTNETKIQNAKFINKILNTIRNYTFNIDNNKINFTFSAGISDALTLNRKDLTIEKIINKADERLYKAKRTGRNKIIIED